MSKFARSFMFVLVAVSFTLAACAPATTQAPAPTEAPPPTEALPITGSIPPPPKRQWKTRRRCTRLMLFPATLSLRVPRPSSHSLSV